MKEEKVTLSEICDSSGLDVYKEYPTKELLAKLLEALASYIEYKL